MLRLLRRRLELPAPLLELLECRQLHTQRLCCGVGGVLLDSALRLQLARPPGREISLCHRRLLRRSELAAKRSRLLASGVEVAAKRCGDLAVLSFQLLPLLPQACCDGLGLLVEGLESVCMFLLLAQPAAADGAVASQWQLMGCLQLQVDSAMRHRSI